MRQTSRGPRRVGEGGRTTGWQFDVERFLRQKAAERTVGDAWVRRIRWELERLPRLLRASSQVPVPRSARGLGPDHLAALRQGMRWEKATFAIHFAALRQFARWAGNPVGTRSGLWRLPSGQPTHRRWLTREQLGRLLAAARGRERLLVALEGLNGLRRIEVLRLRRKDVLGAEGCLRVLGKGRDGGKWRQIPMHPTVRSILAAWPGTPDPEGRLLPVATTTADAILRRAARRAGFDSEGIRVSHHDLRRTFGRVAHESGMDLVQLKNLLGHASVEMTVHYIGLDADRMRRGLELIDLASEDRSSPRSRASDGRATG